MIKPVTLSDIGSFLQSLLYGFDDMIIFAFVLMVTFSLVSFFYKLLIGRFNL